MEDSLFKIVPFIQKTHTFFYQFPTLSDEVRRYLLPKSKVSRVVGGRYRHVSRLPTFFLMTYHLHVKNLPHPSPMH